jgi:hypothetical protein
MNNLECLEEFERPISVNGGVGNRDHRPSRRHCLSPSIFRAKVAREKKPPEPAKTADKPADKTAAAEITARSQMTAQPAISVDFHNYPEMVAAFRAIKDHIAISNAHLDVLCSFGDGHVDKLLGPSSVRGFARDTLDAMLWGLCIKGTFTIDMDRVHEMQALWEKRCAANTRSKPSRISKAIVERARPIVLSELAKKGWETRRRNLISPKNGTVVEHCNSRKGKII